MASRPPRILCIGRDPLLLQSRCAVLSHNGYDAQAATVPGARRKLQDDTFDLVILSGRLSERKRESEIIPAGTQTLEIQRFLLPSEMLEAVAERLRPSAR
jgi:hypothetical protein